MNGTSERRIEGTPADTPTDQEAFNSIFEEGLRQKRL
jgi:hypothetical protein